MVHLRQVSYLTAKKRRKGLIFFNIEQAALHGLSQKKSNLRRTFTKLLRPLPKDSRNIAIFSEISTKYSDLCR